MLASLLYGWWWWNAWRHSWSTAQRYQTPSSGCRRISVQTRCNCEAQIHRLWPGQLELNFLALYSQRITGHLNRLQATREPWNVSLLDWRVGVVLWRRNDIISPAINPKKSCLQCWAKRFLSDGFPLIEYPDPSARHHSFVMYPFRQARCRRQTNDKLLKVSRASLVELEGDTIQPCALQPWAFWGNHWASYSWSPPHLNGISGPSNGGIPSKMIFRFFLGDIKSVTLGCSEGSWIPVEEVLGFCHRETPVSQSSAVLCRLAGASVATA